jgi:hypothetical protein
MGASRPRRLAAPLGPILGAVREFSIFFFLRFGSWLVKCFVLLMQATL